MKLVVDPPTVPPLGIFTLQLYQTTTSSDSNKVKCIWAYWMLLLLEEQEGSKAKAIEKRQRPFVVRRNQEPLTKRVSCCFSLLFSWISNMATESWIEYCDRWNERYPLGSKDIMYCCVVLFATFTNIIAIGGNGNDLILNFMFSFMCMRRKTSLTGELAVRGDMSTFCWWYCYRPMSYFLTLLRK